MTVARLLSSIEAAARPLRARLAEGASGEASEAATARVGRWTQVVAFGDELRWRRRLAWDGLDEGAVRAALGAPSSPSSEPPPWTATLGELLSAGPTLDDACLDPAIPIPFERALLPLVVTARALLERSLGSRFPACVAALTARARASLERALLDRLAFITQKTLASELHRDRPYGETLLASLGGPANGSTRRYDELVARLARGGLRDVLARYPVLAKLVAIAVDRWVEAMGELLLRLSADLDAVRETFGVAGKVADLTTTISDPHRGGRSVVVMTFEDGRRAVYKPKDLALERAYADLLAWVNARDEGLAMEAPRVLLRDGYGWVEYVEAAPCADEASVRRFYERAGVHVALLYLLGGTDCHGENVIAAGDQMIIVDLETLLHPDCPPIAEAKGNFDSVLRSGLLPRWECRVDTRHVVDLSGLGVVDSEPVPQRRWRKLNTDDMHVVWELDTIPPNRNVPSLDGSACAPERYVDEIVAGFERCYELLRTMRAELSGPGSPLTAFANRSVRFIFRDTKLYFNVLENALAPEHLSDGRDFDIELEYLAFAFLGVPDRPASWPLFEAEVAALAQLDVPYFDGDSGSRALNAEGRRLGEFFDRPAFELLGERLLRLDDADRRVQVELVRASLLARVAETHRGGATPSTGTAPASEPAALEPAVLVEAARAIGDELVRRAVWLRDDLPNWLGQPYIRNTERAQVNLLPANLYDGISGVALFLAALGGTTGDASYQSLAATAFRALRPSLRPDRERARRLARRIGLGGGLGMGSLVYALVRAAALTGDDELVEDARAALDGIAPAAVDGDLRLDVMSGAAGLVLGLTVLAAAAPDEIVRSTIARAADRLVSMQIVGGALDGAWPAADGGGPQTGFSHGAAGIAYALARAHAVTGARAYAHASLRGFAYERRRSLADDDPRATTMISWCHGSAGIALARFGTLRILDDVALREDAAHAITATAQACSGAIDHLCCGNLGRVDALLVAHERLGEPYRRLAAERGAGASDRYRARDAFGRAVFNPALFQGAAGIGYELLRLAAPLRVPSVLLWD